MSIEATLQTLLGPLFEDAAFYALAAPPKPPKLYGVWQQVGGQAINFMEGGNGDKKNARIQIAIWGTVIDDVGPKSRAIEDLISATPALQSTTLGAAVDDYDETTKRYGKRQDFSVWFSD